ncbi:MAG: hypothetical protein HQK88_00265 [Nitrospirae bacterium]|nr:hypothetical protein [Nitrospirota bacterium]MBF0535150.1 hypothetical protein [Nitrospirota bacterium]MBF0615231.1 hypothetical protein [Nitrospirota bacterium]
MITNTIPDWNHQGVLPPINVNNPTSVDRSPYLVSITDIVLRFGTTTQRKGILSGLLTFRANLYSAGLIEGFQWIDGSFLENIEIIEGRSPIDIDVVTFFHLPSGKTQQDILSAHPRLFNPVHTKADHHVDAYFVHLDSNKLELLVQHFTYWYSMWSHRRNNQWKGYLQVDLSQIDDSTAKANLDEMKDQGGQQ